MIPKGGLTYKITAAGKKALSEWYNTAYSLDTFRNTVALRVAFAQVTGRANLEAVATSARKAHEEEIVKLEALIKEAASKELHDDALALAFALSYHRAAITWLDTIKS